MSGGELRTSPEAMLPLRGLILLSLLVAASASPAAAQSSAQRTVIEAFRDSLERATDPLGLARLEVRIVDEIREERSNGMGHLRLGFLALRRAEVGATELFEDAAAEFQWVTRVAPSWPYGWYGLGLAEYGLATTAGPRQTATRSRPFLKAQTALARAIALDPRMAELMEGEALAVRRRQPTRPAVALDAVRQAGRARAASPAILPVLGRLERDFGDPQAALRAFEAFLPRAGGARGLTLLEIARTRFMLGREDGAAPYYEGAVADDTLAVRAYRRDLALIAADSELRVFDLATGPARVAFLRTFWRLRDAAELRSDGERLREHYRRVYLARRSFPGTLPAQGRDPAIRVALREPAVDDRGAIFIRHGEPDDRVRMSALGVEPNESWRYTTGDGEQVLHFVARNDPEVFRLVESLFDVSDVADLPPASRSPVALQGREALLRSRTSLSPFYQQAGQGGESVERDFRLAERALSRASLVSATTSDSYRHRFSRSLAAQLDVVVLETDSARTMLHVAYAVPFDSLNAAWLAPGLEYPLRLRLRIFEPTGNTLVSVDSTVRPVTLTDGETRWVSGMIAVPVPPGRIRMRMWLADGEAGGSAPPVRSLEVAPAPPDAIGLSDLVLGNPGGRWPVAVPRGEPVALNPLGRFGRRDPLELAYQVRAPAGVQLVSQVTLMRTDERAGVIRSDRYQERTGEGSRLARHPVDVRKLPPGSYRLEVTVTDGRGGLARRWKEFVVTDGR